MKKLTRRQALKIIVGTALFAFVPVGLVKAGDKPRERKSNLNRNHEVKGRHKHDE